jgi:DNA polymerase-3 subunit alpha
VIVYQEQVMQIAQIIGGYSLGSADLLRRAMGKKKPEEMAQHRGLFVDGAKAKGYPAELANKLFDLMAMFAEYGFNKSHTAAYAVVTYQTAWLKACYPAEFIAATLSCDMDDTDKVQLFVADAKANRVEILPPDINESALRFEPVGERSVRYGLGAVKGAGVTAVAEIDRVRASKRFTDLFDFCARVDRKIVNRRAIEALVRAGAFDTLDADRSKLLANVGRAIDAADAASAAIDQANLFGDDAGSVTAPSWIPAPDWSERQRLQEEKLALGFFLSGHLFNGFSAEVRRFVRTRLVDLQPQQQPVWMTGVVISQRTQMTRRGKMVFVTIDDGSAAVEVSVFNELYESQRRLIRDDELLVVQARVSRDDYTGGQRAVAERLLDLVGARQEFGKRLRIRLNGIADGKLLRGAIAPYAVGEGADRQAIPVVVEYGNGSAVCMVELGDGWRVRPHDELLGAIDGALHPAELAIEY